MYNLSAFPYSEDSSDRVDLVIFTSSQISMYINTCIHTLTCIQTRTCIYVYVDVYMTSTSCTSGRQRGVGFFVQWLSDMRAETIVCGNS